MALNTMLGLIRRLISRNPISFFVQRKAYNNCHTIDRSQCSYPHILECLVENGICVIKNYINQDIVDMFRTEVSEVLYNIRDNKSIPDFQSSSYPEYGTYILHHVEKFSPSSVSFVNDDMITSVASAYAGGKAISYDARAELRSDAKKNLLVDDWHTDTWKFRFKAMLYLTDVAAKHAPFRYLAGSHTGVHWQFKRFWLDFVGHAFEGEPFQVRYHIQEAMRQHRNPHFKEMICTYPAGTLILFDARGLHCGSMLVQPSRIVLNHSFVAQDDLL